MSEVVWRVNSMAHLIAVALCVAALCWASYVRPSSKNSEYYCGACGAKTKLCIRGGGGGGVIDGAGVVVDEA